eukprot:5870214-Prorocentrum_lima.AAC.1
MAEGMSVFDKNDSRTWKPMTHLVNHASHLYKVVSETKSENGEPEHTKTMELCVMACYRPLENTFAALSICRVQSIGIVLRSKCSAACTAWTRPTLPSRSRSTASQA